MSATEVLFFFFEPAELCGFAEKDVWDAVGERR
jgi:hypothetical protein